MRINWQKVVIFLSVVYVICIIFQATVTIKQLTGKAVSSEGEVSLTITGTTPTISNIDPDGSQYINTPNVTISFTTDQTSNCSYSQTETEYDDMTRISDSIEATGHNFTITNLINKQYTYNFKCIDTQDEESALNILIFTTSLTNRTDNNLLINETDFTILNYTGQTRKIEQNITQHTQTQITTNIQIPILNETHQLTLQIEGNKTREFISTEDYTIISPATANIQRAIYGGDDKSLITRISESDSNYYNQEQSITIVTNST